MAKATTMAVVNQKGGTGKTTTCENLGIGLANEGKRVLLVDTDPQASLTIALGHPRPDEIPVTLTDLMAKVIQDQPLDLKEGILTHEEGVDLIPANITLSGMEVSLVNAMSRETVLRQVLEPPRRGSPLLRAPNVTITGHIAWLTRESRLRAIDMAVDNFACYLRGQPKSVIG